MLRRDAVAMRRACSHVLMYGPRITACRLSPFSVSIGPSAFEYQNGYENAAATPRSSAPATAPFFADITRGPAAAQRVCAQCALRQAGRRESDNPES